MIVQHSRGYAPKGKTPVVTVTAKRFSSNMISAVNNPGTVRFMIYGHGTSRYLARTCLLELDSRVSFKRLF